jgi:tRNA threonylcarbamoyladenosine biosynthesis protein TsaB
MMRILGIDSSVPQGSVALLENDQIISEKLLDKSSRNHSDGLLKMVDEVLSESEYRLRDIDGFSVTCGPGSFTGLRVGVSLVKGFALATEKPALGVGTLEALSASIKPTDRPICAILDARKKEVYCAFFRYEGNRIIRTTPDEAMSPEDLCQTVSEPTVFTGSGLETYGEFFSGRLGSFYINQSKTIAHSVGASAAFLARPHLESNPGFDLDKLTIKYVRKSEAELNYLKKV